MRILVTGGAGYIGSHTCKELAAKGFEPIVYDNLVTGHQYAVKWGPIIIGDILDTDLLARTMKEYQVTGVIHFAALSTVAESVKFPEKYHEVNVNGSQSLFRAMKSQGINKLVFSSSAAVYGKPKEVPISEGLEETNPINPYGQTKLLVEQGMRKHALEGDFSGIALRYFNACGASTKGEIGEHHDPETHLIPLTIRAALDSDFGLTLNGNDFETPDGTCIRDYVHVDDLACAHVQALLALDSKNCNFEAINLGSNTGYSNMEIIKAVEKALNMKVKMRLGPRRPGDPDTLVASNEKAQRLLDWKPTKDLENIVNTAAQWYRTLQKMGRAT